MIDVNNINPPVHEILTRTNINLKCFFSFLLSSREFLYDFIILKKSNELFT